MPWWWKWEFHCSSSFLKATSLICEAQLSFAAHQNIFFGFSHCDGWLREFGLCFPSYLYFCETGSHGWIISCSQFPWSAKLWIWMGIYFRDILLIRISRGTNNCVQRVVVKNIYFIMRFPPFSIVLVQWKVRFLWFFLIKVQKD